MFISFQIFEAIFVFFSLITVLIIQILLVVLKLFGSLTLSWLWVFSVFPIAFLIFVILVGLDEIFGFFKE
jgi:hypothetical protein